ncbi:MAG TPA: hypothetical protein PKC99_12585 [Anaerolineales bacterium]|nr:hypothetical protein [Anaerolineales bacterium]
MNPIYSNILHEFAQEQTGIERAIIDALLASPSGLTRGELVRAVFGVEPKPNIANDSNDRKNRIAINALFLRGVPIVATSSGAGYKISDVPADIRAVIAEAQARIEAEREKIRAGETILQWLADVKDAEERRRAIEDGRGAYQMELSV